MLQSQRIVLKLLSSAFVEIDQLLSWLPLKYSWVISLSSGTFQNKMDYSAANNLLYIMKPIYTFNS